MSEVYIKLNNGEIVKTSTRVLAYRMRRAARMDAEEKWITINGTHVQINEEGSITKGPEALKRESKKESGAKATGSSVSKEKTLSQALKPKSSDYKFSMDYDVDDFVHANAGNRKNPTAIYTLYKETEANGGDGMAAIEDEFYRTRLAECTKDLKEISRDEANEILYDNLRQGTVQAWFREYNHEARDALIWQMTRNPETHNAALNIMYQNYKAQCDSDGKDTLPFDEFLVTPVKMYRGGSGKEHETASLFSSYTFNLKAAESFTGSNVGQGASRDPNGIVYEGEIRPIDTYGSVFYNGESEVLVPRGIAPNGNRDSADDADTKQDILRKFDEIKKRHQIRKDSEPDAWITVNGNHIPIDKDGNPMGGQMKAIGGKAGKSEKKRIPESIKTQIQSLSYYGTYDPDSQKKRESCIKSLEDEGINVNKKYDEGWGRDIYSLNDPKLGYWDNKQIEYALNGLMISYEDSLKEADYIKACDEAGVEPDFHKEPEEYEQAWLVSKSGKKQTDGTKVYSGLDKDSILTSEEIMKYSALDPDLNKKGKEKLEADTKKIVEGLSDEELNAIRNYTSEFGPASYRDVNAYLRGKNPDARETVKKSAELLNSALNHEIGSPIVTFRGTNITEVTDDPKIQKIAQQIERMNFSHAGELVEALKGKVIKQDGVMSTSAQESTDYSGRLVKVVLKTPSNAKALDISGASHYGGGASEVTKALAAAMGQSIHHESEVAYKPGTEYKIDDVLMNVNERPVSKRRSKSVGQIVVVATVLTDNKDSRMDEEPSAWITVNGNHIPLNEKGEAIGGQMKALGKGREKEVRKKVIETLPDWQVKSLKSESQSVIGGWGMKKPLQDYQLKNGASQETVDQIDRLMQGHSYGGQSQKEADSKIVQHLQANDDIGKALRDRSDFETSVYEEWKESHPDSRQLDKNGELRVFRKGDRKEGVECWTIDEDGADMGHGGIGIDHESTLEQLQREGYIVIAGMGTMGGAPGEGEITFVKANAQSSKPQTIDSLYGSAYHSKEYKALDEKRKEKWEKMQELDEKVKSIPAQLPKEKWSDSDRELVKLLGKQYAPYNPEWYEATKESDAAREEWHKANEKMNKILLKDEPPLQLKDFEDPPLAERDTYKGFRKGDSGTSTDFSKAYLVEMSPKEYLQRCAAMFNDVDGRKTNLTMQVRQLSRNTIKDLKEKIQNGTEMYTPWLDERGINGQEGRHRAAAAYELGIDKIPVYYWPESREKKERLASMHKDADDVDWITVNGNHIPIDPDTGKAVGGQQKALGEDKPKPRLSAEQVKTKYGKTYADRNTHIDNIAKKYKEQLDDLRPVLKMKEEVFDAKRQYVVMFDRAERKYKQYLDGVSEEDVPKLIKKKESEYTKLGKKYDELYFNNGSDSELHEVERQIKETRENIEMLENYSENMEKWERIKNQRGSFDTDYEHAKKDLEKTKSEAASIISEQRHAVQEVRDEILSLYPDYDSIKTGDDAGEYLSAKGYFDRPSNVPGYFNDEILNYSRCKSLGSLEPDYAPQLCKTFDDLFQEYPQMKNRINGIGVSDYGECAAAYHANGIDLEKSYFSTKEGLEELKEDKSTVRGDKMSAADTTVCHEFGHAIDDYLAGKFEKYMDYESNGSQWGDSPSVASYVLKETAKRLNMNRTQCKEAVSRYACKYNMEWFAEVFAAYKSQSNPNDVVKTAGSIIESLLKE